MAITLELSRPKLNTVNNISPTFTVGTVVETDTAQEESFFIPINMGSQDPPSFTVTSSVTTNASNSITTTNNGFENVKVGDLVTGTGIPVSTTVSAKNNSNTITISNNATASGTVTLTFDPPAFVPSIYALKVTHSKSGSLINLSVNLYSYDGSLGGTPGTSANATNNFNLISSSGSSITIDVDAFLAKARIPRLA